MQYTAHGAVKQMKLGNGLWEHSNFNTRLQVTQIGLGTAATNSSVLQLDYGYGATANNGNLLSQSITIPGLTLNQSYTYDALNRLQTANENGGVSWKQKFLYDRYGNRRIDTAPANTSPDLIGPNPVLSETTNRIVAQAGEQYDYDDAGNLTHGRESQTYGFDGENKMTTFNGGASQGGADYSYDGDGRRVKKVVGTVTTVFVYDVFGNIMAEYGSAAPASNGTRYLTSDHLGSPRVVTDSSGTVQARHDYHPFGEEVGLRGGRSAQHGYVADEMRQKFTLKERDVETGLDYFLARYYSSTQGRFTSPDQPLMDQEEGDPQSWNLYSYVRNNPLRFSDPTGQGRWEEINGELHWVGDVDGEYDTELGATWVAVEGNPIGGYWDFGGDQSPALDQRADALNAFREFLNKHSFEPPMGGGLRNLTRSAPSLISRIGRWFGLGKKGAGFAGGVTREAIEAAASDPGPTIQVVTRLTQAPGVGRALSVATGEGAETLANAARTGGQVYRANIPRALIETLKSAGLVRESVTQIGGVTAREYRFAPEAAEFISRFFR
jgi:RHS repeat-associated protein